MPVRTQTGPFLYGEGVPLEINPNHPWADDVLLALPLNRRVLEDVSPHGDRIRFGSTSSTSTDIVRLLRPNPAGGFMVHNGGRTDFDGVRMRGADHTRQVGETDYEFFGMGFVGFPHNGSVTYGAPPFGVIFAKGNTITSGEAGKWTGPYFSSSNQFYCQFDTGADASALALHGTHPNDGPVAFGWGQSGSGNERKFLRRQPRVSGNYAATTGTAVDCGNTHDWVIANSYEDDSRDLQCGVWNCVVLARYLTDSEWLDWAREPHQLYRRRRQRRFFAAAGAGGGTVELHAGSLAAAGTGLRGALAVAADAAALALLGRQVEAALAPQIAAGTLAVEGRPLSAAQAAEIVAAALGLIGAGVTPAAGPLTAIAAGILNLTGAQLGEPGVAADLHAIVRAILREIVRRIH